MSAAVALGGFTGPGGGHARLRDPQEEVVGPAGPEGAVRHPGRRARRRAAGHRRGLQGLRAVRALRLQQGPRHLLRADRLPDRVPQGEPHGRLHDRGADRRSGRARRRSRPPSPSAAGWASRCGRRTSTRSHLEFTVEGDAIRFGLLAVKNVGQGAIESIIAARGRGRPVPLADRLLHAHRPAARQPQGARGAHQGRGAATRSAIRRSCCSASTTPSARPRRPSATGSPARRRCSTWAPPTRTSSSGRCRPRTEVPVRERLRWEKELLGLYLSEHPMGEVAEQVGRFVNAYSGDLQGRGARRPARRRRRHRHRASARSSPSARRRWPSRRSRTSRARSRSSSSRACTRRAARPGATARSCSSPDASTTRARRSRCWPTSSPTGTTPRRAGPEAFAREVAAGDRGGGRGGSASAAGAGRPGSGLGPRSTDRAERPATVSPRREDGDGGPPPDSMPRIQPGRADPDVPRAGRGRRGRGRHARPARGAVGARRGARQDRRRRHGR